jgi:hypothetical protein
LQVLAALLLGSLARRANLDAERFASLPAFAGYGRCAPDPFPLLREYRFFPGGAGDQNRLSDAAEVHLGAGQDETEPAADCSGARFDYQFEIEVGPPFGTIIPQISRGTSSESWFFAARLTSDLTSLLIVLFRSEFLSPMQLSSISTCTPPLAVGYERQRS